MGLDKALFSPERADSWDIDSGETFEVGFSDSAFAEDLQFGYALSALCDALGPTGAPFDDLPDDPSDDEDYDAAKTTFATRSCFAAG